MRYGVEQLFLITHLDYDPPWTGGVGVNVTLRRDAEVTRSGARHRRRLWDGPGIQAARVVVEYFGTSTCTIMCFGTCAKHLTSESYTVIYAANSYTYYY